jgi:hypothetical protein
MGSCVNLEEMYIVIRNLTVMKIHTQAPKHACTHAHVYTQTHRNGEWSISEVLHLASFMVVMCFVSGEAALAVGKGNIQQANIWSAEILLVVITV